MRCPGQFVGTLSLILVGSVICPLRAADRFQQKFAPFAKKYCQRCHNEKEARGELNLSRYTEARHVTADFRRWNHIIEFIRGGEMPPEDAKQPTIQERQAVVEVLESILLDEAKKHAGDPGVVLPRRLSNTEYDRSIHDLIGFDIRPTRDFPADPAAGEGFDNTGEALRMSPNLLKKYLSAAQFVSDHMVLKTTGISFAPFPVTSYNEKKKLTEQAIIDFYKRHEVDIAAYVEAAWRFRYRNESDQDIDIKAWAKRRQLSGKYLQLVWNTLASASQSSSFLRRIGDTWKDIPPPNSDNDKPAELRMLRDQIEFGRRQFGYPEENLIRANAGNWPISHLDFRARMAAQRDKFDPGQLKNRRLIRFGRISAPKNDSKETKGSSLFLKFAPAIGDDAGHVVLHKPIFSKSNNPPRNEDEETKHEVVTLRAVLEKHVPKIAQRLAFGKHPQAGDIDARSFAAKIGTTVEIPLSAESLKELDGKHLLVECRLDDAVRESSCYVLSSTERVLQDLPTPNAELLVHGDSQIANELKSAAETFCHAFPNRFAFVHTQRGLAAGFHLVEGFFRDDQPLMNKVLNESQQRELNHLWNELHFVTNSTETLLRGFVWFERAERHVLHDKRFDFLRSEDPKLVEDELLTRFEKVYLGKMGVKLIGETLKPEKPSDRYDLIHGFFVRIRQGLTLNRMQLKHAEQQALANMNRLAERAYRRPLTDDDRKSLQSFYQSFRKRGQSVEASLRGVLSAVLMSPDFFFHFNELADGKDVYPLSDHALASRLSYFLWSSLPDDKLLAAARAGQLQNEQKLLAEMRRMLNDDRIESFAREFFGQWLRYRDYLSKDPINAPTFPGYDDTLRNAMFEEPARLASYLIQQDKPITDLLNSDVTFVNEALAKHYGGDVARQYRKLSSNPNEWHRVGGLHELGRGGLFGMGVVLTTTSKGERTSPVKRGFWAVHHLLGQHFPPPPADVPELPPNEKEAKTTIRELIVAHTANPKCAMCHTHFDSLGMALEGFDPIGRARTKDLAGRPIDNVVKLPNGKTARGIPGLIEYIETNRRKDFVRTMCRKFLGYALGRSVVLSDKPLLLEMEAALEKNEYRFSVLFEMVVRSKQFRMQRGQDFVVSGR